MIPLEFILESCCIYGQIKMGFVPLEIAYPWGAVPRSLYDPLREGGSLPLSVITVSIAQICFSPWSVSTMVINGVYCCCCPICACLLLPDMGIIARWACRYGHAIIPRCCSSFQWDPSPSVVPRVMLKSCYVSDRCWLVTTQVDATFSSRILSKFS